MRYYALNMKSTSSLLHFVRITFRVRSLVFAHINNHLTQTAPDCHCSVGKKKKFAPNSWQSQCIRDYFHCCVCAFKRHRKFWNLFLFFQQISALSRFIVWIMHSFCERDLLSLQSDAATATSKKHSKGFMIYRESQLPVKFCHSISNSTHKYRNQLNAIAMKLHTIHCCISFHWTGLPHECQSLTLQSSATAIDSFISSLHLLEDTRAHRKRGDTFLTR